MARAVDADILIKDLTAMKKVYDAIELDGMIKALKEAPTIEADPVRHGKWEDYDGVIRINCSNCGKVYLNTTILEVGKCNFCPNCGAKMDKE